MPTLGHLPLTLGILPLVAASPSSVIYCVTRLSSFPCSPHIRAIHLPHTSSSSLRRLTAGVLPPALPPFFCAWAPFTHYDGVLSLPLDVESWMATRTSMIFCPMLARPQQRGTSLSRMRRRMTCSTSSPHCPRFGRHRWTTLCPIRIEDLDLNSHGNEFLHFSLYREILEAGDRTTDLVRAPRGGE